MASTFASFSSPPYLFMFLDCVNGTEGNIYQHAVALDTPKVQIPNALSKLRKNTPENRFLDHWRTARGGHGLPIVSPGPAMPYPSLSCRQVTTETAFPGVACPQWGAGGLPAAIFYPFGSPTPYAYDLDVSSQKSAHWYKNRMSSELRKREKIVKSKKNQTI
jgi:hypothetical protein